MRVAGLLAVAIALAIATPAVARAGTAVPPEFYGVNWTIHPPGEDPDVQATAMSNAGLSVVRQGCAWHEVEPDPPQPGTQAHIYRWDTCDSLASVLSRHGLQWYPILGGPAPWASLTPGAESQFGRPARTEDFVAYVTAFAMRYGRNGELWRSRPDLPYRPVTTYEIWNEPNFSRFWRQQDNAPEDYADLYIAARRAIHVVEPHARVVVGGLMEGSGASFMERMDRHLGAAKQEIDAIGFHTYAFATAAGAMASIRDFRRSLERLGQAAVPIEVTEVGWSTLGISEQARASNLSQLASQLPEADLGVTRLIPHLWVSEERDLNDWEQWLGIYNRDGTPKPSGAAYAQAIRQMKVSTASSSAKRASRTRKKRARRVKRHRRRHTKRVRRRSRARQRRSSTRRAVHAARQGAVVTPRAA